jgi:hypothetical protein
VIGEQVNVALGPSESATSSTKNAFSLFWESSGVVLLDPQVPKPDELASRFLPALDKFLVASSINVHENTVAESDPRKHAFVSKIKQLHQRFRAEVVSVVSLSRQFSDGLAAMLEQQRLVRHVSPDELLLKTSWVHDRFVQLLESLLQSTQKTIVSLQKNFLDAETASVRSQRMAPLFALKDDDIWRAQKQSNANFVKSKGKIKKRTVQRVIDPNWLRAAQPINSEGRPIESVASSGSEEIAGKSSKKSAAARRSSRREEVSSDDGTSSDNSIPSLESGSKKARVMNPSCGLSTINPCPPMIPTFDLPGEYSFDPWDNGLIGAFTMQQSGPMTSVFDEVDDWCNGLDQLVIL